MVYDRFKQEITELRSQNGYVRDEADDAIDDYCQTHEQAAAEAAQALRERQAQARAERQQAVE